MYDGKSDPVYDGKSGPVYDGKVTLCFLKILIFLYKLKQYYGCSMQQLFSIRFASSQ
jgi:hypothetical protein